MTVYKGIMKAADFDLKKEIGYLPEQGLVVHEDKRLLLMDANALGLLMDAMIKNMGFNKAMEVFMQSGFEHGYSDFLAMEAKYGKEFANEIELFASGPVIHSWEGLVHARPSSIEADRTAGKFYSEGIWSNSWQAQQYLTFNSVGKKAVCYSLTGYASGWTSAFMGKPVLAIETACIAKGDNHCSWLLKPAGEFGEEAATERNFLKDQFEKLLLTKANEGV